MKPIFHLLFLAVPIAGRHPLGLTLEPMEVYFSVDILLAYLLVRFNKKLKN